MGLTTQTYDIISRIAVGNGSLVYRAMDKASNRQVALKLLVQDGDLDHRLNVDALLADSPRLRKLAGTHVCQLLDAYRDEDGPVLVYEFAHGLSGRDLPVQRKLSPDQALDLAAQMMSALRSGERQKCPHGDVKPSNVVFVDLLGGRPFLILLDWGLAAHRRALHDDSLPFLAPERLAGGPASHPADLFSAGAVLFFLCTGKLLVGGTKPGELIEAWRVARPAVLAKLRPDLPAKLVQWICSLLECEPGKRPPSAVAAAATLATMGLPPPPVPPESIRPRAATTASGISKSPMVPTSSAQSRRPSAISRMQPAARTVMRAKPAHPAVTFAIYIVMTLAVSIGGWFAFIRDRDPAAPEPHEAENAEVPPLVREAPQSVGPPIPAASHETVPTASENPPQAKPHPRRKPPLAKPQPPEPLAHN